jgi:hypothetical protein
MQWLGDYKEDDTVYFLWSTNDADGASVTRATDGTVQVYKDNGVSQSVAGVTDTEDFDSLTGIHACTIDLSADAFYATGADYAVVLAGATIDGQTVNAVLAHFSIENRYKGVADALATYDPPTKAELDTAVGLVTTVTDNLPDGGALSSLATAAALTTVDTVVDAIKAKTDNLPADPADDSDIDAQLATIDTVVDAIKAKTDNLPADPADDSDIDSQLSSIASEVTAILADTGTDGVVLADNAITAAKIDTNAIDAGAIAANAIGSSELADGCITAAKLAADCITAAKIATDAITSDELAATALVELADQVLKRSAANVEATADADSLAALILARFHSAIADGTWTLYRTDDSTPFDTYDVTEDAEGVPITGVADPT